MTGWKPEDGDLTNGDLANEDLDAESDGDISDKISGKTSGKTELFCLDNLYQLPFELEKT